jgi:anti-repressor protein
MELIKITEQNGQRVVSARELYEALGLDLKNWSRWAKKNITENQFAIQNEDWIGGFFIMKNGNEVQDFAITLDFAKRLSMLARTEKGEHVRSYFIECEKKALGQSVKIPTPKELAQLLIAAEEEKERLLLITEKQSEALKTAAPKVEYHDKVLSSESTYNTNLIAKEMGMSAITLNQILKDKGIQYKQGETWILSFKYQNLGYTKTKTHSYTGPNGETKTSMLTVWTELGRKFIHETLKSGELRKVS